MKLRNKSALVCVSGCPERYGSSQASIVKVTDALDSRKIPYKEVDCTGICNEVGVTIGAITNVLITGLDEKGEAVRRRTVAGLRIDETIGLISVQKLNLK